jgi:hypothetical protein
MQRPDQRTALRHATAHAAARNPAAKAAMAWLVFAIAFGFTAAMVFGLLG